MFPRYVEQKRCFHFAPHLTSVSALPGEITKAPFRHISALIRRFVSSLKPYSINWLNCSFSPFSKCSKYRPCVAVASITRQMSQRCFAAVRSRLESVAVQGTVYQGLTSHSTQYRSFRRRGALSTDVHLSFSNGGPAT